MIKDKQVYIHYGNTNFEKERFVPIYNEGTAKPRGGFWGSPIDAKFGWKDWNDSEHFCECNINNSVQFVLSDNAKVLHIDCVDQLDELPIIEDELSHLFGRYSSMLRIDWVDLCKDYDAIELHLSDEKPSKKKSNEPSYLSMNGLYWKLYGWDCDSIVVMNPDVVEVVE